MTGNGSVRLRISLTNVTGLGATELAKSLLPALERAGDVAEIYLPATGKLAGYRRASAGPLPQPTRRRLPNAVSRLLECTLLSRSFEGVIPLLVLGDLPLCLRTRQIVFVHTPHLLVEPAGASRAQQLKFAIARAVFRANATRIDTAIVQTETMRRGLVATYPVLAGRIHVVPQPAPQWLLASRLKRTGRTVSGRLRLFYPAAPYPHKNHAVLHSAAARSGWCRWVETLAMTVPALEGFSGRSTLHAVGRLDPDGMRNEYALADALIFPSLAESYGLPLVEAMWVGLPILCADLPYARDLCGDGAIYFSPRDPASLESAVQDLASRLADGWWPDWRARLERLPVDWDEVARRMVAIAAGPHPQRS